jgi:hypothetical protein
MKGYIEAFEKIAKNQDMAIKCVANKLKINERLVRKGYDHFIYSPFISEKDITSVVRWYRLRLTDEREIRKILSF